MPSRRTCASTAAACSPPITEMRRVRPHPQEARAVGAAAHAVVAGAEAAADDHGELRHLRAGDGRHHLGAVLGDAAGLVFLPDHEAGDVLQEQQRNAALAAQLDEVRALQRRFREQDAVVGDDADGIAEDMGEAADQRRAVELLELVELADRRRGGRSPRARRRACGRRSGRCRTGPPPAYSGSAGCRSRHAEALRPVEVGRRSAARCPAHGRRSRVVVGDARGAGYGRRRRPDPRRVTTSPVAAFTSGGPPRKIVPWLRTMIDLVRHRRHIGAARRAAIP